MRKSIRNDNNINITQNIEVEVIIEKLYVYLPDSTITSGPDGIPAYILKCCADVSEPGTLLNRSLQL